MTTNPRESLYHICSHWVEESLSCAAKKLISRWVLSDAAMVAIRA